jgi:hypothetical protein
VLSAIRGSGVVEDVIDVLISDVVLVAAIGIEPMTFRL